MACLHPGETTGSGAALRRPLVQEASRNGSHVSRDDAPVKDVSVKGDRMLPSLRLKIGLTLGLLAALALSATPLHAAIGFDAASRAATTSTGRTSLSWSHTVGAGTDRLMVVGVAVEDAATTDANITSVTYGGVALTAVPNSKRS